jgi:hypothetical protein
MVDGLRGSGVRVVGDLEQLAEPVPVAAPGAEEGAAASVADTASVADAARRTSDEVWAEIGARASVGIVLASGLARGAASRAGSEVAWPDGPIPAGPRLPPARVEPLELARLSTPLLGYVLVRRLIGSVVSRLPLPRRG